jgi:acetolactate synthase-1/2/3 large subunit
MIPINNGHYLSRRSPPRLMSGAEFIAATIKGYDVTHVFFMEAILRAVLFELEARGVRTLLAHSEKAAAYMADGYARVRRGLGICMAQSVGAANLAAGLQDPFLAGSSVVAFTGRQIPLFQYRNAYQEITHFPLYDPVTKYNVNVDDVRQLPYLLRQAFREATTGAPAPVHLDVLDNLGRVTESAKALMEVVVEEPFKHYPAFRPAPPPKHIEQAARLLEESSRPVLVAGGGTVASSAASAVVELAERLNIPVATSLNGKGSIPEMHPLSVGVVGTYSCKAANRTVYEADLVLFIGSRTGDQVTNRWCIPKVETPVVQIDIEPAEIGRNYPNVLGLHGDAKVTLRGLLEAIGGKAKNDDWYQRVQQIKKEWSDEIQPLQESNATPIKVERLCKEISDCLPPDAVLTACTGWSGVWTGAMLPLSNVNQTYIRAAGSLGWGFPASLGAKCGAPDRPVVCFTGDGGFWYHLSEMETASRYGINTVTIINNNHKLGQDSHSIKQIYGERPENEILFKFKEVNFARIADEMGCDGIRVERPEEIAGVFKDALAADRPVVIEVITDPESTAPGPWTPDAAT